MNKSINKNKKTYSFSNKSVSTEKKYQSKSRFKKTGSKSFSKTGENKKSGYKKYRYDSRPSNLKLSSRKRINPYRAAKLNKDLYVSKAVSSEPVNIHDKSVTFSDFKLNDRLLQNIKNIGYVHPTHIQSQVIQSILQNKDVLGLASTGSGKTAAFLIPIVNNILNNPKSKCLVITPTRELANQIKHEFVKLAKNTNLREVLLVGGASAWDQIRLLNKNPKFVFATPGRLLDLYSRGKVDLSGFDIVVLDEVDQMLDMGFLNDIKKVVEVLKKPRQSLFFSATMKPKLEDVAMTLLDNPVKVEIAKSEAAKNVDQDVIKIGNKDKVELLHDFLISTNYDKVLVFVKTKKGADELSKKLRMIGHQAEAIHSNKSLGQRNRVLSMFKQDMLNILVATDVAARGIDVKDISHVINYDEPANYDDYIHRIGRTGRAGKPGKAITFIK